MMNNLLLKQLLLSILISVFAYAGTYDYSYSPLETEGNATAKDPFMYGDFDKVIRFKALQFEGSELTSVSHDYLDTIVNTVEKYKDENKTLGVSIVSHTASTTDDANENVIRSNTYAESVIGWFSTEMDQNESARISEKFAEDVQKLLIDKGVEQNMTTLEFRGGQDKAYSDATTEGRDLSNRVMVTLYVFTPEALDIDSDGDGVFDSKDECPETPKGVSVDPKGCPLDTDGDGVYDYKDQCPGTPKGVEVNNDGCPLDTDGDGVYDYKDQCPGTPPSFKVDINGCPLSKKLMLNFEPNLFAIEEDSYGKVEEFAIFLKENPQYKAEIVGHTDSVGKKSSNMALSQGRANSVREALIKEGVDASRLQSRGRGELEPIANNRTTEGRRANRRIEVKLFY